MYINSSVAIAANGSDTDVLNQKRIKDIPPQSPYPYLVNIWVASNVADMAWELYVNDESVVERSTCKQVVIDTTGTNAGAQSARSFPDRDRDFVTSFIAPANGGRLQLQAYASTAGNFLYAIEISPIVG